MILGALCREITRAYQHIRKVTCKPPTWDAAYAQVRTSYQQQSACCGLAVACRCLCSIPPLLYSV
jgi:hypothetical protein